MATAVVELQVVSSDDPAMYPRHNEQTWEWRLNNVMAWPVGRVTAPSIAPMYVHVPDDFDTENSLLAVRNADSTNVLVVGWRSYADPGTVLYSYLSPGEFTLVTNLQGSDFSVQARADTAVCDIVLIGQRWVTP